MPSLLIFILGMLIGSFLNVCIYRIPREESIAFPPSHCTQCNTRLKPIDLIPVLSYLFYRGKCRYCKDPISFQYPFIELLTGFVYLLLFIKFQYSVEFIFFTILCTLLIVISGIDYEHQIIPDGMVVTIAIVGIVYLLVNRFYLCLPIYWTSSIVGLIIGGGFFLFITIVSKGGMGGGDIKLMGVLGIWLGWKLTLFNIFLSFILGAILSIILLSFKIKGRKDAIPFGPFIAIATLLTILYGERLIYWYLNNILM